MRSALLILVALALVASLTQASRVTVAEPVSQEISSDQQLEERVVDFGVIGPGQKLEVQIRRPTGELAKNMAYDKEAIWDKLYVLPDILPPGWEKVDSLYYEDPLTAFVKVAKDAPEGDYQFTMRTLDELEGVEPLTFIGKVRVSRALLDVIVEPAAASAGVGQPAVFIIKLRNRSSANDAFRLSASGLPTEWRYTKEAFVPHNSELSVTYEVAAAEAGDYRITFNATSLSSEAIQSSAGAGLQARSSLLADLQATTHGILLFPSVEQVVYSLLGLLANLVR